MTRIVNAWWLARLKLRPVGHVLWGGRPALDLWIGSPEDLRLEQMRKLLAERRRAMRALSGGMTQAVLAFRDGFTPAVRRVEQQLRALAKAHEGAVARAFPGQSRG